MFALDQHAIVRKRTEAALRESDSNFAMLVNLVPQLVWICTHDGSTIYVNERWLKYTGLTLEQSYGDRRNTPFHPGDKQRAWEAWDRATASGETYAVESRLRGADGSYRWFLLLGEPQRDAGGNIVKWFGTCTDIEQQKADALEIRKLNENLEERVLERTRELAAANRELERFAYSLAHDLRAPLRHTAGFSRILLEDFSPSLPLQAVRLLERIEEGVQRMGLLVDELSILARVGRSALNLQPTRLNLLVEEVLCLLEPETQGRSVTWKIAQLPSLQCDPTLTRQVFQNLIGNALKFTRPREEAIIEIGFEAFDGDLVLQVRDNGVGFDPNYADKLFGIFQRLHRAEDFEGTGIGLATVQRIVQKHGGRIWAEAELNKGATFCFTLEAAIRPRAEADQAAT